MKKTDTAKHEKSFCIQDIQRDWKKSGPKLQRAFNEITLWIMCQKTIEQLKKKWVIR
jgi:hypothetical protein